MSSLDNGLLNWFGSCQFECCKTWYLLYVLFYVKSLLLQPIKVTHNFFKVGSSWWRPVPQFQISSSIQCGGSRPSSSSQTPVGHPVKTLRTAIQRCIVWLVVVRENSVVLEIGGYYIKCQLHYKHVHCYLHGFETMCGLLMYKRISMYQPYYLFTTNVVAQQNIEISMGRDCFIGIIFVWC